jgi:hypothetical protein
MKKVLVALVILCVLSACSQADKKEELVPLLIATASPNPKLSVTPPYEQTPIIQMRDFLSKDAEALHQLFGQPQGNNVSIDDTIEQTDVHSYETKAGMVKVTYDKGKVKQLSIELMSGFHYPADAMKSMASVGLTGGYLDRAADQSTEDYMSFKDIEGFFTVKVYSDMTSEQKSIARIEAIIAHTPK